MSKMRNFNLNNMTKEPFKSKTKQSPKQEAEFLKPILIGAPILAVIFLAYFFTLILLVA